VFFYFSFQLTLIAREAGIKKYIKMETAPEGEENHQPTSQQPIPSQG
jgi:hypothetical protein